MSVAAAFSIIMLMMLLAYGRSQNTTCNTALKTFVGILHTRAVSTS